MPYLVDGNNLLGSWGGPSREGDRRIEVVRRIAAFCRAQGGRAVLVFDGAPFRDEHASQELGAVSLRFPRPGSDADSVIKTIIDGASRPQEWIVVTSDKPLYSYVRTRGARVLRAHEWNALERRAKHSPATQRGVRGLPAEKPEHERDVSAWLDVFDKRDPPVDQ